MTEVFDGERKLARFDQGDAQVAKDRRLFRRQGPARTAK